MCLNPVIKLRDVTDLSKKCQQVFQIVHKNIALNFSVCPDEQFAKSSLELNFEQ